MGSFISSQNEEVAQGRYGVTFEHNDINDKKIRLAKTKPAKNVSLQEHFPKVYDQNGLSTSVAQAIASVIEYEQVRKGLKHIKVSKLYIHLLGLGKIRKTLRLLDKYGVISEKLFPYDSMTPYPDVRNLSDYDKHYVGKIKYKKVPGGDIEIVKMCLSEGVPIIFSFDIYNSFDKRTLWDNDGVMPIPQKGERYLGTQAGVIVGYSRKKRAVIVRNSWGGDWKNEGYFFLPYNYLVSRSCGSMWTIDIENDSEFEHIKEKAKKSVESESEKESDNEPDTKEMTIELDGCAINE